MRYIEEKENVNPFQVILSVFILAICLFTFYNLRGGHLNEKSFQQIANIQYLDVEGNTVTFYEPFAKWSLRSWKAISRLSYLVSYQSFLAIIYSVFLHLALFTFEREKWKLNHHIILYITAFASFNINDTYAYTSEMLGAIFIFTLILSCKLESLFDIFLLILFTSLAFSTNFSAFLFLYSLFVVMLAIQKMKADRMRTAVFYKKKGIAGKFLVGYSILFIFTLILLSIYDFFGSHSFQFLFYSFLALAWAFGPIFTMLFVGKVLMRTERELSGIISSIVFFLIFMGVLFHSYNRLQPFQLEQIQQRKNLGEKKVEPEPEPEPEEQSRRHWQYLHYV